jgi:hypothetical protein
VPELKVALSLEEVEYLRTIHVARALQELKQHPGWEIFTELVAGMVERMENQHLDFAPGASRDAYWISGVRLAAVRDFAKILQEQIAQKIDLLNQPLRPPEPAEPEGE